MNLDALINIKKAIKDLNPSEVQALSERPVRIGLHARSEAEYASMEGFFLRDLSPARRSVSAPLLIRTPETSRAPVDLSIYSPSVPAPANGLIFVPEQAKRFVAKTLTEKPDLAVPLARSFTPFRKPVVERIIAKTSRENTLFSVATALPDIVPSIIELPWAIAEFASDTAFLTMNQIRMAFLLAAASDREVGYTQQKSEIAMVIGSAFGWRALARQLVGKIPFGGGLIGKAAVAYAGSKVLGLSLDHYYSIGYGYTRDERDRIYADAFRQGKAVAFKMLRFLRPDLAARFAQQAGTQAPAKLR